MKLRITALLAVILIASACRSDQVHTLTVGAVASTEGAVLVEIVAQHLEKRLGVKVVRKLDVGGTSIGYESLVMSAIDIFPEETNALVLSVLKEQIDANPDVVTQRVRGEMERLGKVRVFNPLGIHRRFCLLIRTTDAQGGAFRTISEASRSQLAWTMGITPDFEERADGYSSMMSAYKLPLKVSPRNLPQGRIYTALTENSISMAAGHDTDGPLADTSEFTVLGDDKQAFTESRTCLLARETLMQSVPKLEGALAELSGRFTNESIQRMNHQVDVLRQPVKDVAAGFLKQSGL